MQSLKVKYENTKGIRILIRILFGAASVICMLGGIFFSLMGIAEGVEIGKEENYTKVWIGILISVVSPFILHVLYRLALTPFDIIDAIKDKREKP